MKNKLEYEAQKQIISFILNDNNNYFQFADRLSENLFFDVELQQIFSTIKKCFDKGIKVNAANVAKNSKIKKINYDFIIDIVSDIDYNSDFESYLFLIEDFFKRKIIREVLINIQNTIEVDDLNDIKQKISDAITTIESGSIDIFKPLEQIVDEIYNKILQIRQGNIINGIPTGFTYFDEFSGGLQNSDLIILAGETSQGKTTLALNICDYISINNDVAIYSYEMTEEQLITKLISKNSEIPSKKFRDKNITDDELSKIADGMDVVKAKKIRVADIKNNSLNWLTGNIRSLYFKYKIKVVIIDYLQLLSNRIKGESKESEIGGICRTLKNLAKELNIPIILLSQLSRDRNNLRPSLSRLRDSGQIEESADVVMFVHRPEYYGITHIQFNDNFYDSTSHAEIIIAKGRNIGITKFILSFNGDISKFKNVTATDLLIVSAQSTKKSYSSPISMDDEVPF